MKPESDDLEIPREIKVDRSYCSIIFQLSMEVGDLCTVCSLKAPMTNLRALIE